MASISSLTGSSSSSSIYGSRNVISGLASGLDTETLIENSIQGYKTKIQNLISQQTKLTWKQDGYRSITDKLIALKEGFSSYTSKTNLSSPSFFSNSVITTTSGENADKVSATGKSNSDIQINAVQQLATAARYSVSASSMTGVNSGAAVGEAFQLEGTQAKISTVSGTLELTVGSRKVELSFDEDEVFESAQDMLNAINEKLKEGSIGEDKASDYITAELKNGTISFQAKTSADDGKAGTGDSVWISGASGDIKSTLGIQAGSLSDGDKSLSVSSGSRLYRMQDASDYLSGKSLSVSLDGTTKKIDLGDLTLTEEEESEGVTFKDKLLTNIQDGLKKAFGSKVEACYTEDGALSFSTTSKNSTLKVTSDAGQTLGLGSGGVSNYLDMGTTLSDLFGDDMNGLAAMDAVGDVKRSSSGGYVDEAGNSVKKVDGSYKRVDNEGNLLYTLRINDQDVGTFTKDSALDSVVSAINNSDAGVKVSYSQMTNKFSFTATETGSEGRIEFGEGLATKLFTGDEGTSTYTAGQDAVFSASVNGEEMTLTRSSNVVSMDGLTVTLKGTFNNEDEDGGSLFADDGSGGPQFIGMDTLKTDSAVSFTTKADSDKIVDAVKSFVEQYNAVMKETREAYSTMPAEKSSTTHERYEPLTDEDKEGMSDTAIEEYEEKAKQGILFGDTDLSRLYDKLRSAISPTGDDRKAMEAIGLTTGYSEGLTTLELDEDQLRAALESNPDSVQKVFTSTTVNGSSSNGLMNRVSNVVNAYASTSVGSYGVLVRIAGTKTSSLTLMNNNIQSQMSSLDDQIDRWQEKMSDKIDYYTNQFTQLEQLMNEMNSQSSALASLMGTSY